MTVSQTFQEIDVLRAAYVRTAVLEGKVAPFREMGPGSLLEISWSNNGSGILAARRIGRSALSDPYRHAVTPSS